MTRLYGENAEKECAYLPQKPALVNRESRSSISFRSRGKGRPIRPGFAAKSGLLRIGRAWG
jgi:hypothetical protein